MEEDDCDYRTPIGKIIKQINCLCKKPILDNQLSEAIDLFHEKLNKQENYLVNGIFRINFAESALFLQSCAELYGKKVDLLWKELLEYHTRLIRYDCDHQKEKGIPINKEVIDKLEERRNRYLRKKNFRLLQEEQTEICVANPSNSGIDRDYLIDEDGHFLETEEADTFGESEEESKSVQMWNNIELETKEHLKVPYAVYQQMTRTYRLKNYPILRSEDFDILDMEDGEFNTKYSRVPGWNHIFHLIEYNNEGLLPDNNNLIAKLKLTVEGKMKFLTSRKIPLDTPFEEYKNEYMEYRNQFFKEEAKKWQNMPLNTFEDFRKQLQLLTHMYGKNDKIERGSLKYSSQHKKGDKIEILDTSDEDSLFELTLTCDDEFTKSDLFVRLEKLSCDIVDTKLRQDSGYYDYSSSSDMENVEIVEGNGENLMGNANVCSEDIIDTNVNKVSDVNDTDANKNIDVNSSCTSDVNPSAIADKEDENNFDARSVLSDHNYCGTPLIGDDSAESKSDPTKSNQVLDKTTEEIVKKPLSAARVHPKVVSNVNKAEEKIKRKINKEHENGESPAKRRKLSQKQLEALLKSKITSVKLMKFEKFFSENYQSEDGEGKVPNVEYDSEGSETEDLGLAGDKDNSDDHEEVRSIHSDHSYCQPLQGDLRNDSGFIEPLSQPSCSSERTGDQINTEEGISEEDGYKLAVAIGDNENLNNALERPSLPSVSVEMDSRERERKESQSRVEEWRNTINPILRNLKEHDFDIHEYGSQIIDGMEINESKPFSSIVQGKMSAEVVRYFISSLQLANTNNIEICGAKPGKLSNDTYNIKLLSKDRFHEHLRDYVAPSVEMLGEKLERLQAKSAQQDNLGPPKAKQLKLTDKTSKGKKLPQVNINDKTVTKLLNVELSQEEPTVSHNTYQYNRENRRTLTPLFPDNTTKGKTIIKRQTNSSHILNFDISIPSTSRHIHCQSPEFDGQVPSTSSRTFTPPRDSDLSEEDQRRSSAGNVDSPNKRRRSESTEETFLARLATVQRMNPDVQVHSTPHGPTPPKHMKTSSILKKSILF